MPELLRLGGSPWENGRAMGRLCRKALRDRVRVTRAMQRAKRIPQGELRARAAAFKELLRKVDEGWLEEAAGLARGAGVTLEEILILNALPGRFYSGTEECTTFVSVGKEENRLFKIRDERNRTQSFFVRCTKGRMRYQGANDIGNLGLAHFLNEHAVGGANNTGSETDRAPEEPRLNDCHMLRYFAENASSIEEIPGLFGKLAGMGAAGGAGRRRGAIFIFADATGGLVLETAAEAWSARFIRRGTLVIANHFLTAKARRWEAKEPSRNSVLRKERMEELLRRHRGRPTVREIFAISRDRRNAPHALCNDDLTHYWMTISAQLHVIDRREAEDSVNYFCCGNTRNSVYLAAGLGLEETFAALASGEFYRAADRLYQRHGCGRHLSRVQEAFEEGIEDRVGDRGVYERALRELGKAGRRRRSS
ncbi:MAG: C45 family autoproteolytic acyltransferase/hydrolase [Planctomycetota bacterium]